MSNVLDYRFFDTENNCYVRNEAAFCIYRGKVCETLSGHFEEEKSIIAEQSTGLTDKHGQLIFEGDVVYIKIFGVARKLKVFFHKEYAGFMLEETGIGLSLADHEAFEVIGNIHEKKYDDN